MPFPVTIPAITSTQRAVETLRPGAEPDDRWLRMTRELDASIERVYRAWSDPDELGRWFAHAVEGSLLPGAQTILIWPEQRVTVEVVDAEPPVRFVFGWSWLQDHGVSTEVTVSLERNGFGTRVTLEEGPFDLRRPGVLHAFAEALEGWGEAIANLRAQLDFSVDLRRLRRPS